MADTDLQTSNLADKPTHRHAIVQANRRTDIQSYRQADAQACNRIDKQAHKHAIVQTSMRVYMQTYRQAGAQTCKRTDKQAHRHAIVQTSRRTDLQTADLTVAVKQTKKQEYTATRYFHHNRDLL